jgi:phage terminase large subunit-like protein
MKRTTYPAWVFDDTPIADPFGYGQRAVTFLRNLRHPKAPGRRFKLDRWQERIVRAIYGPRHEDETRIVKTAVLLLPRGNRKTSLAAALALLHTVGPEKVPGGEVLSAASDQKQAKLAFNESLGIIQATSAIDKRVRVRDYVNRITETANRSFYECISSDAGTQHGRTPVFVLADELHAWKKRDLWDVLKSGLVKTPGSLLVVATTSGRGQENIAFEIVDYARKVAKGEIDDPAFLPVLFETSGDADWKDEDVWFRANPGLSCSPSYPDIAGLRQLAKEGENRPGDRDAFRQLNLNVWLDHSTDPFVDMGVYDQGAEPFDLADFEGAPCWIAVDASVRTDLTAVVACFRSGETFHVAPTFFVPADNLRLRAERDGVPYPRWAEEGFIVPTPGNVIDYHAVEGRARELCSRFNVREIAFDPAYARQISVPLISDGFPVVEMRQGWRTMGPAIAETERAIIGRQFPHGGNPVLRWCFDNVAIQTDNVAIQTDSAGNKSFHKGKSRDRIDGAVAAAMAVARAAAGDANRSIFDDPTITVEDLVW